MKALASNDFLWDSNHPSISHLRATGRSTILPIASSLHKAEAGVKESLLAASGQRSEFAQTEIATTRNVLNTATNQLTQVKSKDKVLKANQYTSSG